LKYNRQFWDSIFSKAQRPILREVFQQLEDRMARYYPFLLKLFPTARPSEILIEIYRKGKIGEAFRAFKKIYWNYPDAEPSRQCAQIWHPPRVRGAVRQLRKDVFALNSLRD
jgi:hypothetical protein